MDKTLIGSRFAKAKLHYAEAAVAQQNIARRMTEILQCHLAPATEFPAAAPCLNHIYEVGCGTGNLTRHLLHDFRPVALNCNDLCPEMEDHVKALSAAYPHTHTTFRAGDAEHLPLPEGVDAVVSCSALQWLESPETFVSRCHKTLPSGGILAYSTFGPSNLCEIRSLTGQGLNYPNMAWHGRMVGQGFEVLHLSEEQQAYTFDTPMDVLRHLQSTGVTGVSAFVWTPTKLQAFLRQYTERYATGDGGVRLTYHPIYVLARKR